MKSFLLAIRFFSVVSVFIPVRRVDRGGGFLLYVHEDHLGAVALHVARVGSITTRLLVQLPLLLFVYYFQVNTGGVSALLFWIKLKFICLVAPSDPLKTLYYTILSYPILSYTIMLSYPTL